MFLGAWVLGCLGAWVLGCLGVVTLHPHHLRLIKTFISTSPWTSNRAFGGYNTPTVLLRASVQMHCQLVDHWSIVQGSVNTLQSQWSMSSAVSITQSSLIGQCIYKWYEKEKLPQVCQLYTVQKCVHTDRDRTVPVTNFCTSTSRMPEWLHAWLQSPLAPKLVSSAKMCPYINAAATTTITVASFLSPTIFK